MKNKFLFVVLAIVLLVIVGEGLFYLQSIRKQGELSKPPVPEKEETPSGKMDLTGLQISKKVFNWIDKQLGSDSLYKVAVQCNSSGECRPPIVDSRAGLSVLWGSYNLFKKTGNQKDLGRVNYLLNFYSDDKTIERYGLQINFWNCKWLYLISQEELLNTDQKAKAEKICRLAAYYPYTQGMDKKKIEQGIEKIEETIDKRESPEGNIKERAVNSNEEEAFISYSTYASDYASKYLWFGRKSSLEYSKDYFYKAVDFFGQSSPSKYLDGKCVLGIASLDLYKATKEDKFLNFGKKLFEKEEIESLCLGGKEVSSSFCTMSVFEKTTCALFARELAVLTKEEGYSRIEQRLIDSLINSNFDYLGYPGYQKGYGAFFGLDNFGGRSYSVRENALMGEVLTK